MKPAWSVILFTSLSQAAAREPKPVVATPAQMVDAIVNRNQPPKLVDQGRPPDPRLALFPEDYDWAEEKRVHKALETLYQDTSIELWDELVRRENDNRYCVTLVDGNIGSAYVRSVGSICGELAYWRLTEVFSQHLPKKTTDVPLPIHVEVTGEIELAAWRMARREKPFYQLQIAVCEEAIKELAKREYISQGDKDVARKKIEFEIETMRSTKQPLVRKRSLYGAYEAPKYTPELAERVREAVKNGRKFAIWK